VQPQDFVTLPDGTQNPIVCARTGLCTGGEPTAKNDPLNIAQPNNLVELPIFMTRSPTLYSVDDARKLKNWQIWLEETFTLIFQLNAESCDRGKAH
jgi:hypothetical protein